MVRTVSDSGGRWIVKLAPMGASAEPTDLVVTGQDSVTLHDVVVGDVWFCSGQSNMEVSVNDSLNPAAEAAAGNYPDIRQLGISHSVSSTDGVQTEGWKAASSDTVGHFCAVGYFFARNIYQSVGVPIGIVRCSWGATPIEAWMSDAALNSTSVAASIDTRWQKVVSAWTPELAAQYPAKLEAWRQADLKATQANVWNTMPFPMPPVTNDSPMRPGILFNNMVAPLQKAAICGFLWYQGESNAGLSDEYAELLTTLIKTWRAGWGQGDLPFYFVQIANYGDEKNLDDRSWAKLRDAQTKALSMANTGMAVSIDIGEAHNVHPKNKQEVGRRLALIAKAQFYHVQPESSGPVFSGAVREGNALRVHFTHAGSELVSHGGAVTAVEIAGVDRVFHTAAALIDSNSLLVSSLDVSEPVAVRYAWTNSPTANLYNDSCLPAVPFRSDDW